MLLKKKKLSFHQYKTHICSVGTEEQSYFIQARGIITVQYIYYCYHYRYYYYYYYYCIHLYTHQQWLIPRKTHNACGPDSEEPGIKGYRRPRVYLFRPTAAKPIRRIPAACRVNYNEILRNFSDSFLAASSVPTSSVRAAARDRAAHRQYRH